MSYSSIRTIVNMVAGAILIVAYIVYALGANSPAPENLRSWATAILVFIGIGVAALIVIQVLFHIALAIGIAVKERECDDKTVERIITSSMIEDERDKVICLKSSRVGCICAGIGFVAALVALAFGMASVVALHIASGAFAVGSIIEGIVGVYYYEKGVRNG